MNECEQIHPLLRGYLGETLSARDRRLVARHLNLCASARRELDRLRSGPVKQPETPSLRPSEPWDFKVLRLIFGSPNPKPEEAVPAPPKKEKGRSRTGPEKIAPAPPPRNPPSLKPILFLIFFFAGLALLTHFIHNGGQNPAVKGVHRWLAKKEWLGVKPSLEMVVDLTNLTRWDGKAAPVAFPAHDLITDRDRLSVYWNFLAPGAPRPDVDFTKDALAVVFLGAKERDGYEVRFKRIETYTDKTVIWYDEAPPSAAKLAGKRVYRPWMVQKVPKPVEQPVIFLKVQ